MKQKITAIFSLFALTLIMTLASCVPITENAGGNLSGNNSTSVTITLPRLGGSASVRAISADDVGRLKNETVKFRIIFKNSGRTTTRETTGGSVSAVFEIGSEVKITVECLNAKHQVIVRSVEKTITMKSGTNSVEFKLSEDGEEIKPDDPDPTPEPVPPAPPAPGPEPEKKKFSVSYSLDGGDWNPDSAPPQTTEYTEGDTVTVTANVPTKPSFTFIGWKASVDSLTPSGGGDTFAASSTFTMPSAAVIFTAQWTNKPVHDVTYDLGFQPSGGSQTSTVQVAEDDSVSLAAPSAERKGYTFKQWLYNGAATPSDLKMSTTDITLVAKWNVITYTLSYEANGVLGTAPQTETFTVDSGGENVTLKAADTFSQTGYTLSSWSATGGSSYNPGTAVAKTSLVALATGSGNSRTITLTAQWTINSYQVTYALDGGSCVPASANVQYNANVSLDAPTKTGYNFMGWSYNGVTYGGTSGNNSLTMPAQAITLTAQWTANTYNITYSNTNGGTGSADTTGATASFTIETQTITFATKGTLEKIACQFAGWETADGTDVNSMNAAELIALITSGDTLTLQVKWIDGKRTVLYDNGLLIINELPENRTTDVNVTMVYAAMKDDGSNYVFSSSSNRPWNGDKASIKSVEIGSDISPTSTANWFSDLSECTSITLTKLNTSSVTDMFYMFVNCAKLTSLDLRSFNTSSVTKMSYMFKGCSSLTSLDLSNFNTSSVTQMGRMFEYCSKLTSLDLSSFDTSNVTGMGEMFSGCRKLTEIYVSSSFVTDHVTGTDSYEMFYGCSVLVGGKGTQFSSNNIDATYARIDDPDNGNPGYFTDIAEKQP